MSAVMPDQLPGWARSRPSVWRTSAAWPSWRRAGPIAWRVPEPSGDVGCARSGCTTRCVTPRRDLARWAPDARDGASCGTDRPVRPGPRPMASATRGCSTRCATIPSGYAGWDMVGRMLYCADYLEPGRAFKREWRAELARRFPDDPVGVLRGSRPTGFGIWSSPGGPFPNRRYDSGTASSRRPRRADCLRGARAGGPGAPSDPAASRERVAGHAYPVPSPERRIRVEVLNGTGGRSRPRATRAPAARAWTWCSSARGPAAESPGSGAPGRPGAGRDVAEALGVAGCRSCRTRSGGWTSASSWRPRLVRRSRWRRVIPEPELRPPITMSMTLVPVSPGRSSAPAASSAR